MNETQISAFLYFGFDPTHEVPGELDPWSALDRSPQTHLLELGDDDLIREGVAAFNAACAATEHPRHVVPLSGGKDSRAVLGALLDQGLSTELVAVTFGTPGTIDYELGRLVARRAGVAHESIDLTRVAFDRDSLVRFAERLPSMIHVFDAYWNALPYERFGKDALYWSGWMGGPVAGVFFTWPESTTWREAQERLLPHWRFQFAVRLEHPEFEPTAVLPAAPRLPSSQLGYDDQLQFTIPQPRFIRLHVIPEGYECRTPFIDLNWVNFIMNVAPEHRRECSLYKTIIRTGYPTLFSLPLKEGLAPLGARGLARVVAKIPVYARIRAARIGRRRVWGAPLVTNYIDAAQAIRKREDMRELVRYAIRDLQDRDVVPWLDLDEIWRRHQARDGDYAMALTLLTSLSLHLEANDRRER